MLPTLQRELLCRGAPPAPCWSSWGPVLPSSPSLHHPRGGTRRSYLRPAACVSRSAVPGRAPRQAGTCSEWRYLNCPRGQRAAPAGWLRCWGTPGTCPAWPRWVTRPEAARRYRLHGRCCPALLLQPLAGFAGERGQDGHASPLLHRGSHPSSPPCLAASRRCPRATKSSPGTAAGQTPRARRTPGARAFPLHKSPT